MFKILYYTMTVLIQKLKLHLFIINKNYSMATIQVNLCQGASFMAYIPFADSKQPVHFDNDEAGILLNCIMYTIFLQCFDAVGWAAGRASGL